MDSGGVERYFKDTPVVVNNMCLKEIKIAVDDCVVKYLTIEEKYKQNHCFTDWKILLMSVGSVISGIALYYHKFCDFYKVKNHMSILCVVYFVLLFIISVISNYEGSRIFIGKKGKKRITVRTHLTSPSTDFIINVKMGDMNREVHKPIETWFDMHGKLLEEFFVKDMRNTFCFKNTKSE